MRNRNCVALAVLLCLVTLRGFAEDPAKTTYELPGEKNAPVLVLDYEGGFTPPRKNNEPALLIQADGTVILGAPFGQKKRVKTQISQEQVQELLRFALAENHLGEFDADAIKKEMAKGGPQLRIADAPTTVVRIQANGKQHEAKFYALGLKVSQYPQIKALAHLENVRKRLEQLRTEINAGGKAGIAKHLKLANAKMKAEHPDLKPLTVEDLQSAWQRATGETTIHFQRTEKLAEDTTRYISANVQYPVGKDPQVTVRVNLVSRD